jgi:hypothetical protein
MMSRVGPATVAEEVAELKTSLLIVGGSLSSIFSSPAEPSGTSELSREPESEELAEQLAEEPDEELDDELASGLSSGGPKAKGLDSP